MRHYLNRNLNLTQTKTPAEKSAGVLSWLLMRNGNRLDQIHQGLALALQIGIKAHLVDAANRVRTQLAANGHAKLRHVQVLVMDIGLEPPVGSLLGEGHIPTERGRLA